MTDSTSAGMPQASDAVEGFSPHVLNQLQEICRAQHQPQQKRRIPFGMERNRQRSTQTQGIVQAKQDIFNRGEEQPLSISGTPLFFPPPSLPTQQPMSHAYARTASREARPINPSLPSTANFPVEPHYIASRSNRQPSQETKYTYQQPLSLPHAEPSPRSRPQKARTHFTREQQYKQAVALHNLAKTANAEHKFTVEEFNAKEVFRHNLEQIARQALEAHFGLRTNQVKLICYGSIANGFALKNCDMDLLLRLPPYGDLEAAGVISSSGGEQQFKADVQHLLWKALLDNGFGSRLITQTRVPILKACQTPPPWLMKNLRAERARWEQATEDEEKANAPAVHPKFAPGELDPLVESIINMDFSESGAEAGPEGKDEAEAERLRSLQEAADELRPKSSLDFTDKCGIQCDINFSNSLAIENSLLLRTYTRFDQRVKDLGTFVKIWAKARDINCPYRGTLCSYGYILMVLHYLMNVAKPPVIPNLQFAITCDDSWHPERPIPLVNGFDVRFVQDPQGIQQLHEGMAQSKNKESLGSLLRGFFMYYGTHQGFHWMRDVISIRTNGGLVSKQSKGWTQAVTQQSENKAVRVRYIVAIEDPFETEHNVGRTVGHTGVVKIRNEFRRAWDIIERIGLVNSQYVMEDLIRPLGPEAQVDTLQKDFENRKRRQVRMKLELEIKEKDLLYKGEPKSDEPEPTPGTCPDSDKRSSQSLSSPKSSRSSPSPQLTSSTSSPEQEIKLVYLPPGRWRRRGVRVDLDDEAEAQAAVLNKTTSAKATIPVSTTPEAKGESSIGEVASQPRESDSSFSDQTMKVKESPTEEVSHQRVPSTLYPGVESSVRPRDEDPNIMPIPRRLGYKVDQRQMEDLTVISQGGNGCARNGAQFNIEEEEYEWGGGGMMGHKLNSTSKSAFSGNDPPSFAFGKGDEEGYLNELPALST